MIERIDLFLYKIRYILAVLLVVICLFLLSVLLTGIGSAQSLDGESSTSTSQVVDMNDSNNAVTNGFMNALNVSSHISGTIEHSLISSAHGFTSTVSNSGKAIADSSKFMGSLAVNVVVTTGRGLTDGALVFSHRISNEATFIVQAPVKTVEYIDTIKTVSSVAKSSNHNAPVTEGSKSTVLTAAAKTTSPTTASTSTNDTAAWPIHGAITTLFGVPELPYEAIHTGLDISDGEPSGVTPIKAFKKGVVIDTIYGGGLGNHVIVDHGGGITSVYGHMSSISVTVGQQVDTSTTLGFEGTTGVSTGPHLHFEIRVNGQAVDPHKYISGQPYD